MKPALFSLFENAPHLSFPQKHLFFCPLDEINHVYYLEKGFVRMYRVSQSGAETTILTFRPGSVFPLLLLFAGKENVFYFQGSTATIVQKESVEKLQTFLHDHPELLFPIVTRFAQGLYGLSTRIGEIAYEESQMRLVKLLLYFAQKFGKQKGIKTTIELPLTHLDIATWLGVSRETVSRQLAILKKKRIITTTTKQITIRSIKQLQNELKSTTSNSGL